MPNHYVVMADVIGSRDRDPNQLMAELDQTVNQVNTWFKQMILSPLTVTLGDEFQGVVGSLHDAVQIILSFEEARLRGEFDSQLRYVVVYGDIATPLNRERAYGMLGAGLTEAREQLNDKRRGRPRFFFDLPDGRVASQLSRLMEVMSSLTRDWRPDDASLIFDMLKIANNEEVAVLHGKDRSQVRKRRKNLYVDEYRSLKEVVLELSEGATT
jgi:hypothetical protein